MKFFWNNALESYSGVETVDIASTDYTVVKGPARGLLVTSTGNVILQLEDGSQTPAIPIVVSAGHHFELRGYFIKKVIKSGTTATVLCALL